MFIQFPAYRRLTPNMPVQKKGTFSYSSSFPSMFLAATLPWSQATSQCSMRICLAEERTTHIIHKFEFNVVKQVAGKSTYIRYLRRACTEISQCHQQHKHPRLL
eukprot:gb/GECG01011995.1/.p1 GENE.gb/GECG01011995.1/~~gb/GECG01011995.1/.p1  ORF type:complete len:104 (+),score=5.26 gb/GECG01011995.1/:1-312(+)